MSLRLDELSRAERPFHARGSKVVRCEACLLPTQNCICEFKPEAGTDVAVLFLMYKGEYYKPTNTGRLIADVVKDKTKNIFLSWYFHTNMLQLNVVLIRHH